MTWRDIVAAAVVIPVLSLVALWAARKTGHWFVVSMSHTFGQVVLDVMAPDMAHLSTKVTSSLDELRYTNTADHAAVQESLEVVDERLSDVESRLQAVESLLNIRPPNARTRATDRMEEGHP